MQITSAVCRNLVQYGDEFVHNFDEYNVISPEIYVIILKTLYKDTQKFHHFNKNQFVCQIRCNALRISISVPKKDVRSP